MTTLQKLTSTAASLARNDFAAAEAWFASSPSKATAHRVESARTRLEHADRSALRAA